MKFPVLVNINIITEKGQFINRAVLDFYYKNIESFVNGKTGNTLVTFSNGYMYDIQINFEDMYNLYNIQNTIHEQFKEEVDSYAKDNFNNMIGNILNDNEDDSYTT